jgi:hypothetical protein
MQGLFFETDTTVRLVLRFLVLLLGFWTAWRTGRAIAENWQGLPMVVVASLGLGFMMRFLHFSLFGGPFVSPFYYLLDVLLLAGFAFIGFQARRTSQMVDNYYWLYDRTSYLSWKKKD